MFPWVLLSYRVHFAFFFSSPLVTSFCFRFASSSSPSVSQITKQEIGIVRDEWAGVRIQAVGNESWKKKKTNLRQQLFVTTSMIQGILYLEVSRRSFNFEVDVAPLSPCGRYLVPCLANPPSSIQYWHGGATYLVRT